MQPGDHAGDPAAAAAELRRCWGLGDGSIPHLVRTMERHGLIVTLVPFAGAATKTIDAFSTSHLPQPVVVLIPDRADDVYRHRFTAAHELGHLVLHGETAPGDRVQEKEADSFAAELLTPRASIVPQLPARLDLHELERLGQVRGVGVEALVYRCHEVGTISDATYRGPSSVSTCASQSSSSESLPRQAVHLTVMRSPSRSRTRGERRCARAF